MRTEGTRFRGDAYELVLAFFDKEEDERKKMKAHVREQEQKLKRLEIDASGGKDNAENVQDYLIIEAI